MKKLPKVVLPHREISGWGDAAAGEIYYPTKWCKCCGHKRVEYHIIAAGGGRFGRLVPLFLAAPRLARAIQNAVERIDSIVPKEYDPKVARDWWGVMLELKKIRRNLRDAYLTAATPDAKD